MTPPQTEPAARAQSVVATTRSLLHAVWNHPGNRRRRVRAIATVVAWQVWERAARRPWTTSMPDGMKLRVHPHSPSATGMLYCGLLEWEHMNFVKDVVRPGDVVIDVGANVGVYTLLMAGAGAARVWSFEPGSDAGARLRENVALNGLDDRVRVVDAAVSDHEGEARLSVGFDAMDKLLDDDDPMGVSVRLVTIDAVIPQTDHAQITLVKIDVEGFEAEVLRGAHALLVASHPILIVEANDIPSVRRELEPLGYLNYRYEPATRQLERADWDRTAPNLLAIADPDAAARRIGHGAS